MNKVLIIDDEQDCIDLLKNHITFHKAYGVIAAVRSIKEATTLTRKHRPDLVFLDIHLGSSSGFEYLELFRDSDSCIVVTTAYAEHELQALRLSALGFLCKPFTKDEFAQVLHKFETDPKYVYKKRIEVLLNNINHPDQMKINIPVPDGILYVKLKDIIRLQTHYGETDIYLTNGEKYSVTKKLKDYDENLSSLGFCRTHRSHLVNLIKVVKYHNTGYAEMEDGELVEVSTRRKPDFLGRLGMNGS